MQPDDIPEWNDGAVAQRWSEILGGKDALIAQLEAEYWELKNHWEKDVVTMGRILRAHLHVEHYLTEYLANRNPALGDLDAARLTFAQKVQLLPRDDARIGMLRPGLKRLNNIRNRLAHNLQAGLTDEDVTAIMDGIFKHIWVASGRQVEAPAIDVLEFFAEWASSLLHGPSSKSGQAFAQALAERGGGD